MISRARIVQAMVALAMLSEGYFFLAATLRDSYDIPGALSSIAYPVAAGLDTLVDGSFLAGFRLRFYAQFASPE